MKNDHLIRHPRLLYRNYVQISFSKIFYGYYQSKHVFEIWLSRISAEHLSVRHTHSLTRPAIQKMNPKGSPVTAHFAHIPNEKYTYITAEMAGRANIWARRNFALVVKTIRYFELRATCNLFNLTSFSPRFQQIYNESPPSLGMTFSTLTSQLGLMRCQGRCKVLIKMLQNRNFLSANRFVAVGVFFFVIFLPSFKYQLSVDFSSFFFPLECQFDERTFSSFPNYRFLTSV